MTKRGAILVIALSCNVAAIGVLGFYAWDAQRQLAMLRPLLADTSAIYAEPDAQITTIEQRLDAIENNDRRDTKARETAQLALDNARAAQEKADEAYRRVLDICIINRIC